MEDQRDNELNNEYDEEGEEYYTVVEGDSLSLIVSKTGVPSSVLLSLNPKIEEELFPGEEGQPRGFNELRGEFFRESGK